MLKAKSNTHANSESTYWTKQQISNTQSNVYYNIGNIGIGTNNPLAFVHINNKVSMNYNITNPNNGLIINGTVGIGTNSPLSKLHVEGNVNITNNNPSGTSELYIYNNSNNQLHLFMNGSNRTVDGSGNTATLRNESGILQLFGKSNSGIIILPNGNVGIGTNNPQATLHVNGDMYASGHVIQMVTVQYTLRNSYGRLGNNVVSIIDTLNLVITPKLVNSKIILQWMINGEGHFNTVFVVCKNGTPIGYNTIRGNVPQSGTAPMIYDQDVNSTPSNQYICYIDTINQTDMLAPITYGIGIKGTDVSVSSDMIYYLNRCVGAVGQDNYENLISNGVAWEIAP